MIYFLKRANGDIKIGYTDNYLRRLKQLTEIHGELNLRGIMDGDRKLESTLHKNFSHLRQLPTEWFECGEDLQRFITMNTSVKIPAPKKLMTVKLEIDAKVMLVNYASMHLAKTGEKLTVSQTIVEVMRTHCPEIYNRIMILTEGDESP